MKRLGFATLLALGMLGLPPSAFSQATGPTVVSTSQVLDSLRSQIANARPGLSAEYAAVKQLREEMPELDARKRGRLAVVGTTLDLLGPKALFPMLEELLDDKPFTNQPPSVRQGWRVGLLFAVGRLRDDRARPILEKVVREENDTWVLKAAAEALGKLQDEASASVLIDASQGSNARSEAILEGMAHCRRLVVTQYLVARLAQATKDSERRALIESLRDHGNAWAWKTDVVARSGEGDAVRNLGAEALLRAYLGHPNDRAQVQKALLVIDAPKTLEILKSVETSAPASEREALKSLKDSLRNNPLHKR